MMLKIIISTFLIIITFYIIGFIGFIGSPFLFIVFLPVAFLYLFATALFVIFLLVTNLIWKFLPLDIRKTYEKRKLHYRAIILACFIFFFLCGWAINHYFLPDKFHTVSLVGNAGILLFAIFLGWNLIKQNKKRILFMGTAVFILFISLLTVVMTNNDRNTVPPSTEALKSLPYLTWIPAQKTIHKSGVTKHDQKQSSKGINIYNPSNLSTAYLIDMSGNVIHTWSAKINKNDFWHHIEMDNNGDLLAIVNDSMLIRLDWDSNIKWINKMRFHHDIAIAGNKDIYSLTRKDELVFIFGLPVPIIDEYIVVLSPDGEIKDELSLFRLLKKDIPFGRVSKIYRWIIDPKNLWEEVKKMMKGRFNLTLTKPFDIFHNNTIEIIDRNINGLCKKGDILISIRQLDLIGIVDVEKEELIWSWGPGNLSLQHHPTLLGNGNILIFDNGRKLKYSRIVELDPLTKEIVWEYKANSPYKFYSVGMGSSQRLPKGNTLITESGKGRVFEITRDGRTVWEFYSPEINAKKRKRASIYRMMRITDPENFPFIRGPK